jgi:DNA polymerase (family 10)
MIFTEKRGPETGAELKRLPVARPRGRPAPARPRGRIMDNKDVARVLAEIGVLLELKGENPFKVHAYGAAARQIESLGTPVKTLVAEKRLGDLPGIGEALAGKISTLVTDGRLPYHEELKASVPPGLLEILRVPSIGPKKARLLHEKLGIANLAQLDQACREDRLLEVEGFGRRSQEKILEGIAFLAKHQGRSLLAEAFDPAQSLLAALEKCPAVRRASLAGSVRRRRETVKDLDLVAASDRPDEVTAAFTRHPLVTDVLASGGTKTTVRLVNGMSADLRIVPDEDFPCALHHLTGSKDHNVALRALAQKQGLKVSEWGVFRGEERIPVADEAALFKTLGLAYIPPELRENAGELEAAAENRMPRLVEEGDLRGILHVHSEWSDGKCSIEEWARLARERGYEYIAICDHSAAAEHYAHGLSADRLAEQIDAIDAVNTKAAGVTVLKGIESDILDDGRLDTPDALLARLDLVVASVHSHFTMPEADMTARICRALENPHVGILGHPTGRLLLQREGYAVDLEAVLAAAKRHGVALELNAHPQRYDLDWRHLPRAKALGVRIAIDPDAHQASGINDLALGVGIARKGWLEKGDVLNALPLAEFRKALRRGTA